MLFRQDKRFYMAKKKESPGQVEFSHLEEKFKKIFRKARDKEIKSLLDGGSIKILSLEESKKFRQQHPDHVLTSRYVDRWKSTEDLSVLPENFDTNRYDPDKPCGAAPKSRWCVVGWRDPHIHQIERSAPTPLTSSMYLFFQLCACRKWSAVVLDAKTAFLQAKPTTRSQKLACKMPADEPFPGYDRNQLILLLTEVYGLVSGLAWWRRTLLEVLVTELGYRVNPYDRCVLTLDNDEAQQGAEEPNHTRGVIVVEVDDLLEAGDDHHRKKMDWLEKRLRFGKIVNLMETPGGTGYAGRRIRQSQDGSVIYSMEDYVRNRLKYVNVDRKVLKKDYATTILNNDEETQLRGALAAVNWASREGRPDGAAAASILAGCFPEPKVADAMAINKVISHLKGHSVELKIHAMPDTKYGIFLSRTRRSTQPARQNHNMVGCKPSRLRT